MRTSLLVAFFLSLSLTDQSVTKMLKDSVEDISRFLQYELVPDVKDNNGLIIEDRKMTTETSIKIMNYVDKTFIEFADKVKNVLKIMTNTTKRNFIEIKEYASINLNTVQKFVTKNEETIIYDFTKKLNTVVSKMEARMKQHEDFVTTSVAVCAKAFTHLSRGTVSYDDTFMKSVLIKGESVPDVLDIKTGEFVVPKGGAGIYHISFGVLIDTVSPRTGKSNTRIPSRFAVKSSQGNKITLYEASQVSATVGVWNKKKDCIPASRSITLKLQEGDIITLEQMNPHAEQAYRITFCVHLVHPTLASTVSWENLPRPDVLVLNLTTIFVDPIFQDSWSPGIQEFQVLKTTKQKPEIPLPLLKNMKSPISLYVAGQPPNSEVHNARETFNPWLIVTGDLQEQDDLTGGEGSG